LQHKIKQNHKNNSIRKKYKKYIKLLRLMKTVAAAQNLGGKVRRQTYAENFCEKLGRSVKSMCHPIYDGTKADVEISAHGKISAPAKLPRLSKPLRLQKVRRKSSAPIKS
jgi:hypothetical protein